MSVPAARAQYRAGMERAAAHWLAYWRDHAGDPAALTLVRGHVLRTLDAFAGSDGPLDAAVELVAAVGDHMMYQEHWHTWETLLRQLLARAGAKADHEQQMTLRGALSAICFRTQRIEESLEFALANYACAIAAGDYPRQAGTAITLAEVYLNAGAPERALAYAEEAVALATTRDLPRQQADGLIDAGRALMDMGDLAEAERRLQRAAELATAADLLVFQAKAQLFLGHAASRRQRWQEAATRYETALALVTGYGDEVGRATVQSALAPALAALGRLDEAVRLLEDAVRVHRRHGNLPAAQIAMQRLQEVRARRSEGCQ